MYIHQTCFDLSGALTNYSLRITGILLFSVILCLHPFSAGAQEIPPEEFNPRFEIGLGGTVSSLSSTADWSSDRYYGGNLTFSALLFGGLSIEAMKGIGYGDELSENWFYYGSHHQVNGALMPMTEHTAVGLRYGLPVEKVKPEGFFRIHTVLIGGGMFWEDMYIRSDRYRYYLQPEGWRAGESPSEHAENRKDKAADFNGYYLSAAARWRFDSQDVTQENWYGQYGIDAGLRYLYYTDLSVAEDALEPAPDSLTNIQLFVRVFLKLDLFY